MKILRPFLQCLKLPMMNFTLWCNGDIWMRCSDAAPMIAAALKTWTPEAALRLDAAHGYVPDVPIDDSTDACRFQLRLIRCCAIDTKGMSCQETDTCFHLPPPPNCGTLQQAATSRGQHPPNCASSKERRLLCCAPIQVALHGIRLHQRAHLQHHWYLYQNREPARQA